MNRVIIKSLFVIFQIASSTVFGQNLSQTVRGTVTDKDSQMPIIGANVIIVGSNPILGASTDVNGIFEIKKVPVGRVNIQVTAIGYEPQLLSNIIVESAKETVLNVEGTESFEMLEAVVVIAEDRNGETVSQMTTVSAKTVTVEETGRYAGSFNDPARMVSAFAGVAGSSSRSNDIVVRGNSPRGILWRLEDIEIPNPNHFANEGSTGGPVNTLNATMLANSDFFSGAFAPEYGNALSGVFDTKFRIGNNQKSEQSASIGALGVEATIEGPFSKKYNGSYLVNYRYSSLDLLNKMGIVNFGGIPKYQDGSFKVNLPTKSFGNFSIFGLGGKSSILEIRETKENGVDKVIGKSDVQNALGVIGVNHNYMLSPNSYLHSYISISGTNSKVNNEHLNESTGAFWDYYTQEFSNTTMRASTSYNHKLNRKNTINAGVIFSRIEYKMHSGLDSDNTVPVTKVNASGNTSMVQGYGTWKYRITKKMLMVSGIHYTQLFLNNNFTLEPRIGIKYNLSKKEYLSFGAGLHSKVESISVYMTNVEGSNGRYENENLELTKSMHIVAGFGHNFNSNLSFKTEVYYQYLYDVPVENNTNSSFSMLNKTTSYTNVPLVSEGTGTNYGLELTLERYFSNNYYYMITASFYQSKYIALDKVERNTRFNANYVGNIVLGKEFKLRSEKKNKTLAVNAKISLLGGNRYTPINLEESIIKGEKVLEENQIFEKKGDDIFTANLGVTYRVNRKKVTHELKLDIQNVTNNQAVTGRYYNDREQTIKEYYQLSLIPNIMYVLKF